MAQIGSYWVNSFVLVPDDWDWGAENGGKQIVPKCHVEIHSMMIRRMLAGDAD